MIIVEDGSIVANANSYIDDTYLVSYAELRGISLPSTEAERMPLIINAADYIESFNYKGEKVESTQSMKWPRKDVYVGCELLDENSIPEQLKKAQAQAALESIDNDLFYVNDGSNVKKEKLDVLEVEYFDGGASGSPIFQKVNNYLSDLIDISSKLGQVRLVRV